MQLNKYKEFTASLNEYEELKKYANQMASLQLGPEIMALKDEVQRVYSRGENDLEKFHMYVDYIYTTEFMDQLMALPIPPNRLGRAIDWIINPRDGFNVPQDEQRSYISQKKNEFMSNSENREVFTRLSQIIINPKKFSK